jgi:hypothetical protein
MLDKIEFKHKVLTQNFIFKTEDDVPVCKFKKIIFLHP